MENRAVVCFSCWSPIGCHSHREGVYYKGNPKAENFCSECKKAKEECPQGTNNFNIFGAFCDSCEEIISYFPREDQLIAV